MTVDQAERRAPLISAGLVRSGFFRHREGLFRRRLDARAQELFLPGEQIVVAFDGISRLPKWRFAGFYLVAAGLIHLTYDRNGDLFTIALGGTALGLLIRLVCWLLGSRRVMVAMTTLGVVECSTDWLNRPRAIRQRGPGAEPVFYEGSTPNVGIGAVDVYTDRATELMLWRTMTRVPPRRLSHFAPLRGPWRDAAS